jgi:zona occludens toxin (predicted ATPase)
MIIAYTGLPGSGKTYSLAADAICVSEKYGADIYANFALKGAHYFTDLTQVLSVERGIICVDEMNTLCPAHKWQSLPVEIQNLWTQSRKNDIDLWYTSQRFSKVVESIRSITNYVWEFDWLFGAPKLREPKKFKHKFHRASRFEPADMKRIRRKRLEKYVFFENKSVYGLYDTKFRINTPEYLAMVANCESDPEELPIFGNDLRLDSLDGLDNDVYAVRSGLESSTMPVVPPL